MNTIRSQIIALLLLISGIVLLGGGVWGFYSLYAISHRYEHTTGIIRTLQTKKIYRYRKIRYKKEHILLINMVIYLLLESAIGH